MLLVEDDPKQLPFLALKEAEGLRTGAIYVRAGTTFTEAGHVELQGVINRRIESGHSSQPALELDKHLAQLRTLDEQRNGNDSWMSEFLREQENRFDDIQSGNHKRFIEDAYELKK